MDELHVHTMAGVHKFSKNFRPLQKPSCQRSDIMEVHNLKFRHRLGVVHTWFENNFSMSVTLHRAPSDFHPWGHL